jgi:hypothetical protein
MKTTFLALTSLVLAFVSTSCVPGGPVARISPNGIQVIPGGQQGGQYQQPGRPPQMAQGYYQGGGYGGNNNGYGTGQPQKRLIGKQAVTVNSGYVQAQVMADPANRSRVAQWAESYRRQNGRMPSDEQVTAHFGFPCRVRFVDTPDTQVSSRFIRA